MSSMVPASHGWWKPPIGLREDEEEQAKRIANDPNFSPKNGRAPILELPAEIPELVFSHVFELDACGRPTIMRRMRFYSSGHELAYASIDWNLAPYDMLREPGQFWWDVGKQYFPKTEQLSLDRFFSSLTTPMAKNMRFIGGRSILIADFLELVKTHATKAGIVDENQLRVAVYVHAAFDVSERPWPSARFDEQECYAFWHSYFLWISHPRLQSFELVERRGNKSCFDSRGNKSCQEMVTIPYGVVLNPNDVARLETGLRWRHWTHNPAYTSCTLPSKLNVLKSGQVLYDWYPDGGPKLLKTCQGTRSRGARRLEYGGGVSNDALPF